MGRPPKTMGQSTKARGRPPKTKDEPQPTAIAEIPLTSALVGIIGLSPLLFHKASEKVWWTALLPMSEQERKDERDTVLKHDPFPEYRASAYTSRNRRNPTLLQFPASGFRRGIETAALDTPGFTKRAIGRWTWCEGHPVPGSSEVEMQEYVNIFGTQQIQLAMVKNLGMVRVPDVRCKAIVPQWCCELVINYAASLLSHTAAMHLLSNAGKFVGIGDGRQEKGIKSYGRYKICDPRDPAFVKLKATLGKRAEQEAAMQNPEHYDQMTTELLDWYRYALDDRRKRGTAPQPSSLEIA